MRKLLSVATIIGAAAAFAASAEEGSLDLKAVPPAVIAAFQKAYPGARDVKYEKEDEGGVGLFEVEFTLAGKELEAVYDPQGKLLYTEEAMAVSALPAAVTATLTKSYPKGKLDEAEKLMNPDGTLRGYEVEVEEGEREMDVELDAAGKIVAVKGEAEDAAGAEAEEMD